MEHKINYHYVCYLAMFLAGAVLLALNITDPPIFAVGVLFGMVVLWPVAWFVCGMAVVINSLAADAWPPRYKSK